MDYSQLPHSYSDVKKMYKWILNASVIAFMTYFLYTTFISDTENGMPIVAIACLFLVVAVATSLLQVYMVIQNTKKIQKFAGVNGLREASKADAFKILPSAINNPDYGQIISNQYRTASGDMMLFDYKFYTGSGKNREEQNYTVVVRTVSSVFPHLYLDAVQNGLSHRYTEAQHIALEGNFNNSFKLYSPEIANIEALQLITPDVMETMVALGSNYDIEIEQNRIAVFAPGSLISRDLLPSLVDFSAALHAKLEHRSFKWQPLINQHNERQVAHSKLRDGSYKYRAVALFAVFTMIQISVYLYFALIAG